MKQKSNIMGWFEIPVNNMERAISFYESVFDVKLFRQLMGEEDMAWFPFEEEGLGASGSLVYHKEHYKPSADGVLIYFTTQGGDLADELAKVEEAGGQVLIQKRLITEEIGYMGVFLDTEGNKIAIHSRA